MGTIKTCDKCGIAKTEKNIESFELGNIHVYTNYIHKDLCLKCYNEIYSVIKKWLKS